MQLNWIYLCCAIPGVVIHWRCGYTQQTALGCNHRHSRRTGCMGPDPKQGWTGLPHRPENLPVSARPSSSMFISVGLKLLSFFFIIFWHWLYFHCDHCFLFSVQPVIINPHNIITWLWSWKKCERTKSLLNIILFANYTKLAHSSGHEVWRFALAMEANGSRRFISISVLLCNAELISIMCHVGHVTQHKLQTSTNYLRVLVLCSIESVIKIIIVMVILSTVRPTLPCFSEIGHGACIL